MSITSGSSAPTPWLRQAKVADDWMKRECVVCATSSSLISTFAGFPLDSIKSRLQSQRGEGVSLAKVAADVIRDEGIRGLWRGLPLPLISISIVRTISFTIYSETKDFVQRTGLAKFIAKGKGREDAARFITSPDTLFSVALTSSIAGAASGSVVSLGSAPFELVKVRRQLEFQIERDRRLRKFRLAGGIGTASLGDKIVATRTDKELMAGWKAPGTWAAVKDIYARYGSKGLWTGFKLHSVRDTLGTSLYFAEYDTLRWLLGRDPKTGLQGKVPDWARKMGIGEGWVAFGAGAFAGVTSWALIYPVDDRQTKHQQRALAGLQPRPFIQQMSRLVRGTDEANPKPLLIGLGRLYRGLGISMMRSVMTHGLLWTLIDRTKIWIDSEPFERYAQATTIS
ncbi:hypothetical protein FFLO_06869 [Filobasidium floriforme]|uniref:Mitochondrial carrier protein n=1 Tax=Filobasidium floriforme TaxID=5210 RepID=A0A8K0JE13_9TREE|nr:hypothetical protein FFLO_06869 [Filobasidium floriforme]